LALTTKQIEIYDGREDGDTHDDRTATPYDSRIDDDKLTENLLEMIKRPNSAG